MQETFYKNYQNLQGLLYIYWNTSVFIRYDIFLGSYNGFKYYWSFEPDNKHKYNRIFKTDGKYLWVLDNTEEEFNPGVSNAYLKILNGLHTESIEITDKVFTTETKALRKVNPQYKDLVNRVIHN